MLTDLDLHSSAQGTLLETLGQLARQFSMRAWQCVPVSPAVTGARDSRTMGSEALLMPGMCLDTSELFPHPLLLSLSLFIWGV